MNKAFYTIVRSRILFCSVVVASCLLVLGYSNPLVFYDYIWLRGHFTASEEAFYADCAIRKEEYKYLFTEKLANYGPRKNAMVIAFVGPAESPSRTELDCEVLKFVELIRHAKLRYSIILIATPAFYDRHLDLLVGLQEMNELYFYMGNSVTKDCIQRFSKARPDVKFVPVKPLDQKLPWDPPDCL